MRPETWRSPTTRRSPGHGDRRELPGHPHAPLVRLDSGETIIVSAVEAYADRTGRGDAVRVRSTHQTVHAVGETATAATTTAAAVEPAGSHP